MVKILHAADLHLDSPFASLGEEKARLRRQESRELPERLVEYANDRGAQLLLLSGDLFDGQETYSQTAEMLAHALGQFRGQVVIAPGNHDPYNSRSPYSAALWPANVHIFRENRLEKVELPQYGCTVWGAAFTDVACGELPMEPDFAAGDTVQILVLHGDVDAPHSPYRPIRTSVLAESGLDYAALGHIHQYSGVQYAGKTAYAYPGCPEGRGFDELDDKGFLFGEVDKGEVQLAFVPFARRRYRKITVDVTDRDPMAAVEEILQGCTQDICRVYLTGTGAADEAAMERQLSPLAWQLEVRSQLREAEDLWLHCGEDSLRGLFLADLRAKYEQADEQRRETIEQAVRFGLAAMDNRDM